MKLVSRFGALLSLLVIASCSNRQGEPPKLPASGAFGWQMKTLYKTESETAPEIVRQLGFRNSWRAEYAGAGTATVDVYELKSEAAGLEMTQRWRAEANTVTLFNHHYFAVVRWKGAERAAVTALVGSLERSLPASE